MKTVQTKFEICVCHSYYFDILSILVCNSKSLISFNSLQSQLVFDVLCIRMDQVVIEISTKTLI